MSVLSFLHLQPCLPAARLPRHGRLSNSPLSCCWPCCVTTATGKQLLQQRPRDTQVPSHLFSTFLNKKDGFSSSFAVFHMARGLRKHGSYKGYWGWLAHSNCKMKLQDIADQWLSNLWPFRGQMTLSQGSLNTTGKQVFILQFTRVAKLQL